MPKPTFIVLIIVLTITGLIATKQLSTSNTNISRKIEQPKRTASKTVTPSEVTKQEGSTAKPTISITPTASPKIALKTNSPKLISPTNGSVFKKGQTITIEALPPEGKTITKMVFGAGNLSKHFPEVGTVTSKPYRISYHLYDSPYGYTDQGEHTIIAYAYDESGNYTTDTVTIKVEAPETVVYIKSPEEGKDYKSTEPLYVEIDVYSPNTIQKVELIIGSGQLAQTLTNKPYTTTVDLSHYVGGITSKYMLPFEAKVYDSAGNIVSRSMSVAIVP